VQAKSLSYGMGAIVNAELGFCILQVAAYRFFAKLETFRGLSDALPNREQAQHRQLSGREPHSLAESSHQRADESL
jgi:hypothetical protein